MSTTIPSYLTLPRSIHLSSYGGQFPIVREPNASHNTLFIRDGSIARKIPVDDVLNVTLEPVGRNQRERTVFVTPDGRIPARSIVRFEKAQPDLDFPTGSPPGFTQVLTFVDANGEARRIPLAHVDRLVRGTEADNNRRVIVLVTNAGERFVL